MRRRSAAAGAVVLGSLTVLGGAPADASCAQDSGPAGAPIVFVGTPHQERRGYTRFEVAEVWEGPDLAPEVWLLTGQRQPRWPLSLFLAVASGNDAVLTPGERYVVGASESFSTDDCSIDTATSAAARSLRPEDPREPVDRGLDGVDPPLGTLGQTLSVAGAVAGAVALVAGAVALRSRRRTRTPAS